MSAKMTVSTSLLNGRRVGHFTNVKTLSNDDTIQEAIDGGYVVGKKESIGSTAKGVLRGMIAGIQKDGNGRKINEFISLQPYATGSLPDVTDTVTKKNISVTVSANVLKEMKPDTSDWSFTVEGASTDEMAITTITTGEVLGEIVITEKIHFNGYGLEMESGDTLTWSVPVKSKSGTVAAAKITSEDTRITVLGDALSELASAEYNEQTILFTLTKGTKKVVKSATLRYVA